MRKAIALDANLLVLLVVGLTDPRYISSHKRLRAYTEDDFHTLAKLIAVSAGIVTTPNALTEASNLLRQTSEPARTRIGEAFRRLIGRTEEVYVPSGTAAARKEFIRLGLSDGALLEVGKRDVVILSADFDLCDAAARAGYAVQNFNHARNL